MLCLLSSDAAVEQLESVASRGIGMANGGVHMSPVVCNVGSGTGGVVSLHHFHFRVGVPDSDGS